MKSLLEGNHYMSIAALGKFTIEVTPTEDPQIMNVDASAPDTRKDVVSVKTHPGENVDQFGLRVRGILRALLNGEHKVKSGEVIERGSEVIKKKNA